MSPLATLLVLPPLLILQQAAHTLSSRGKNSNSYLYCAWTGVLSHGTWIFSNGIALWQIGKEFNRGFTLTALTLSGWYILWATLGNVLGMWLARRHESKKGIS